MFSILFCSRLFYVDFFEEKMEKLLEAFDETRDEILENIRKIDISLKNIKDYGGTDPENRRANSQLILDILHNFVDISCTLETLVVDNGFENPQDTTALQFNNSHSTNASVDNLITVVTNTETESVQSCNTNQTLENSEENATIVAGTVEENTINIVSTDTTIDDNNEENQENQNEIVENREVENNIEVPERDCNNIIETPKPDPQPFIGTANRKIIHSNFRNRIKEAQRLIQQNSLPEPFNFRTIDKTDEFFQQRVLLPKKKIAPKPTYELSDDVLKPCMSCWISSIESPSEFYVRTDEQLFTELQHQLNEDINRKHFLVEFAYSSKDEAQTTVGDYCAAYIPLKSAFYRVHVHDWCLNDPSSVVHINLVDTGEKSFCSYKNLTVLDNKFKEIPKLAIRCHFKALSPVNGDTWSEKIRLTFHELTHNKRKPKELYTIYVERTENSYGIDVYEKNTNNPSIATILIDKKLAVNKSPETESTEETDNTDTENEDDEYEDLVEYDNINQAVTGYDARDEARICRFTNDDGKCFKGTRCKLEHIKPSNDWTTTDKILTAIVPFRSIELPPAGDTILMTFTNFISACRFYTHMIERKDERFPYDVKLVNLFKDLNSKESIVTFKPFEVLPAVGEIVLFKNDEGLWCRGQYLGPINKDNEGELFAVDFGSKFVCSIKNIRKIEDKYLYLPFQAVECTLHGYRERLGINQTAVQEFVRSNFYFKVFYADVVTTDLPLSLQVFDRDVNIGLMLKDLGFVEESTVLKPESDSVLQVE